METQGTALMEKIHSGSISIASSKSITAIRADILEAFDELLSMGARIRPLYIDDTQVGWVRGLFITEKKLLSTWYRDDNTRLVEMLCLGSTLTREDIRNLDHVELRMLIRTISTMTDADFSIYPYTSAYASSSNSEALWASSGNSLTSSGPRDLKLHDSSIIKFLTSSEHARLWSVMCKYRQQAKSRLDLNYSSAMVASAFVGKNGTSKLYNSLNKSAKELDLNKDDPWRELIKVEAINEDIDFDDGWGHSHQDDSEEGLLREGMGMMKFDKHEAFMDKFYQQQIDGEKARIAAIEARYQKARDSVDGGLLETSKIMTEAEVLREQERIKRSKEDVAQSAADIMLDNEEKQTKREERVRVVVD